MEWFDFFFALHLGEHLYSLTDNTSKDLHGTNMAVVSGQRLANLTKETLTKISISDESFDHFYTNVAHRSEGLLDEPTLPRKQRTIALRVISGILWSSCYESYGPKDTLRADKAQMKL